MTNSPAKCFPGIGCKKREKAEKYVKFSGSRLIGQVAYYTGL